MNLRPRELSLEGGRQASVTLHVLDSVRMWQRELRLATGDTQWTGGALAGAACTPEGFAAVDVSSIGTESKTCRCFGFFITRSSICCPSTTVRPSPTVCRCCLGTEGFGVAARDVGEAAGVRNGAVCDSFFDSVGRLAMGVSWIGTKSKTCGS